jgi:hypothetical protein
MFERSLALVWFEKTQMFRSRRLLLLSVAAIGGMFSASRVEADPRDGVPAHEVKAEFIERFTRFIDWPESAFASVHAPFVVCTWGPGPLSTQLERAVQRGRIKGRMVRVLRVDAIDKLAPCHLLYLATAERSLVRSIGTYAYGKPLLSVGDQPNLAEAGVLINLVVDDDGFVRFEINRDVAKASGLKISAKLMRLARLVGGRP